MRNWARRVWVTNLSQLAENSISHFPGDMTRFFAVLTLICLLPSLSEGQTGRLNVAAIDRQRIIKAANQYLSEKPITLTASSSSRSAGGLHDSTALSMPELGALTQWFKDYLAWMTTSKNGIDEREAKNNHGTCWVMQVAAFAQLVGDQKLLEFCRERFKTVIVAHQIAENGSFPEELRRTKPYGYSLFNLEAMAAICQILSTPRDNLFTFQTMDGRGFRHAMEFMTPFIANKKSWALKPDVMYDDQWPMRQNSLLFAGVAFNRRDYIELWKRLPADSNVEEVIRNFFIRQPVLWVN